MLDYVIGKYGFFIKTLFSAFGIGYLLRADFDSPIVAYIFIFGAMWSFFRLRTAAHDAFLQSKYISAVLTTFVFWGEHWLDLLIADLSVKGFVGIIIATYGVFILFEEFLNVLYGYCKRLLTGSQHTPILKIYSEKQVFLVSFGMLWGVYFLFFLKQYPGSLSCDTPGQLAQAMGLSL